MSSDEYYRVDRDRIHRCAESLVEQGWAWGDALQVALMQEVALALTDILGPGECGVRSAEHMVETVKNVGR